MTDKKLLAELIRRFGFPEHLFSEWALVSHNSDIFITTPEAAEFTTIKPVRKGIRLARCFPHSIKPTTNAMQLWGQYATRNVIPLDESQANSFIQGQELKLNAEAEDGFVIVRYQEFTLGVGHYRQGILRSQVPRSRRPAS